MTATAAATKPSIDYDALRLVELGAICDTLAAMSPEDWDRDTYCSGWRVRDVVGHIVVGYTTPMGSMLVQLAKYRGNVDHLSADASAEYGGEHTTDELLAELRRVRRDDIRKGIAKVIPASEGLVDHVIHHLDITRPQGRTPGTTDEARRAALQKIVTLGGFVRAKGRAKGLRFAATDLDWSWGEGPLVEGPAEDLLLALSGRPAGLAALAGPGVRTLTGRVGGSGE
jgi:uncharacterized protein (TIGR03083 family)